MRLDPGAGLSVTRPSAPTVLLRLVSGILLFAVPAPRILLFLTLATLRLRARGILLLVVARAALFLAPGDLLSAVPRAALFLSSDLLFTVPRTRPFGAPGDLLSAVPRAALFLPSDLLFAVSRRAPRALRFLVSVHYSLPFLVPSTLLFVVPGALLFLGSGFPLFLAPRAMPIVCSGARDNSFMAWPGPSGRYACQSERAATEDDSQSPALLWTSRW